MTPAQLVILGLAAASAWLLAVRDKITQPLRHWFVRRWLRSKTATVVDPMIDAPTPASKNGLAYWLEYLVGCALCFPVWAAGVLYATYVWGPSWLNTTSAAVQGVLAARLIAWGALKYLRDETGRDWPNGMNWPPVKKS